ncbi:hypothetical protein HYFRA_00002317 [Hymenoscyphus fraxineus]|uniref:DUF336-domain-containing protein n=1 Tax=Hymenoscyphus fraxineus TaxID=746836 RepID=A0A9N9LAR1_9HELO|nr:hypothetical protein HYFRA_00002317 [Hymenoscyphus fraxineus]
MATRSPPQLSLQGARIALAASEAKATSLGIDMNIAIVDASTHLVAFSRMPNAKITSINIAIDKAFTAAGHRIGTHLYKEAVWPGGPAFGLGTSNGGRFVTIGGGLPVVDGEGRVVGAVGVSTGTPAQDEVVARAGVEALEKVLRDEGKVKAKL